MSQTALIRRMVIRPVLLALLGCSIAACGGGGSSSSTPDPIPPPPPDPTLTSIALSPLSVTLAPGASASLAVTGTFSNGSTQALASSAETFTSSNDAVVSVDASGVVTAADNAAAGSVTISARDNATGLVTSSGNSTVVTIVVGSSGVPTPSSISAATQTAMTNAQCTAIQPFYWEIGNGDGSLASGSSTQAGGTPVTATTRLPIASASKWIYGMYVIQKRGGAANLTADDIRFLTFTSGYTYMDTFTDNTTCTPPTSGPDSINHCLTLPSSTPGKTYASDDPATDGLFYYSSGHEENHAGQFQPEINDLDTADLGSAIVTGLGVDGPSLKYNQPLLAGGIIASASDYAPLLSAIVGGRLGMRDALGTHVVCAWVGTGCDAVHSPAVTVHWHYSIAHWVEDDPATGDGAFSSPGAFGFYPWIEANKKYYGVISRLAKSDGEIQDGLASSTCGHALRAAWESGDPQ